MANFYFSNIDSVSASVTLTGSSSSLSVYFSKDNVEWNRLTNGSELVINGYQTVQLSARNSHTKFGRFIVSGLGRLTIGGDLSSLVGQSTLGTAAFRQTFSGCTQLVDASNLSFQGLTLASACFESMFRNCTNLTAGPSTLPALDLANECYHWMFYKCSSLKDTPQLPATGLATYCYDTMFADCTNLTGVSILSATAFAPHCYQSMFKGCTALSTVPVNMLASTTNSGSYNNMFEGCTSLTNMPAISATGAITCNSMFKGCTSLTGASKIDATSLSTYSYQYMFSGCTALSTVPADMLPATGLAKFCYHSMFANCSSLLDAPDLPATSLTSGCYWGMFKGCTSLTSMTVSFTEWFDDPDYNEYTATYQWVSGVAPTGMFAKPLTLQSSWGVSKIPNGWTIGEKPLPAKPLTFISNGNTVVALNRTSNYLTQAAVKYSKNGGQWIDVEYGTGIALADGDIVEFSGTAKFSQNIQRRYYFSTSGQGTITLTGGIASLVSSLTVEDDYQFNSLFSGCTQIVDATELKFPLVTKPWCYTNMFFDCINLTGAPTTLPASSMSDWCYANMFVKCFSLSTAPHISVGANGLAPHCFTNMFHNCTNLRILPTTLNDAIIKPWCYNAMFQRCISSPIISQIPLLDRNSASGCYSSMYRMADNMTLAPLITQQSDIYAQNSYYFMYDRSRNINAVEVLFQNWPNNTSSWLKDVSYYGNFVCPSALDTTVRSPNTVPVSWNVMNYQTMPLTFRSFEGCQIELKKVGSPSAITLQYRKNHSNSWYNYTIGTPITLLPGQCVSFSGANDHFSTTNTSADPTKFYAFSITGDTKTYVYGNIMSLVNNASSIRGYSQFAGLFNSCSGIRDASRLYLPATTLCGNCYRAMFANCTNLIWSPKVLPAASAERSCYRQMFSGCARLATTPQIMATSLDVSCMESMFRGCENIEELKVHFTDWGTNNATYNWVDGLEDAYGTFYKPAQLAEEFGVSRIPDGWPVDVL